MNQSTSLPPLYNNFQWKSKKLKQQIEMLFLHPFGCQAFSQITNEKQVKFNDKAIECIFLNYDTRSKGYCLWPCGNQSKTVLIHAECDVTFHNHIFPKKIMQEINEKGLSVIPINLAEIASQNPNNGPPPQAPPNSAMPSTPPITLGNLTTPSTPPLVPSQKW